MLTGSSDLAGGRLYRNHLSFIKGFAPEIGRGVRGPSRTTWGGTREDTRLSPDFVLKYDTSRSTYHPGTGETTFHTPPP